jgi:L-asparaginase/Glu-tRNA(Gln) amidotransferase subunit D
MYKFKKFDELFYSSKVSKRHVIKIAEEKEKNYDLYDSFIIIYGTDTMAYITSYLCFCMSI